MLTLRDYSPKKRLYLRVRGLHCLYVVAADEAGPCKVGYAQDIVTRFVSMQNGNWQRLFVHYLLWTPGKPVALRMEDYCHTVLPNRLLGEWFAVEVSQAIDAVRTAANECYPALQMYEHDEMVRYLRKKMLDRKDTSEAA